MQGEVLWEMKRDGNWLKAIRTSGYMRRFLQLRFAPEPIGKGEESKCDINNEFVSPEKVVCSMLLI